MTGYVECGYCGQVVAIHEGAGGPFVPCPACGWMVPADSPIPTIPVEEPSPLAFPPVYAPRAAARDVEEPRGDPDVRARGLEPPWSDVREGLVLARHANSAALAFFVLMVFADLFVAYFAGSELAMHGLRVMFFLAIGLLIAALAHTQGQFSCAQAPASHGGHAAGIAALLCVGSAIALVSLLLLGEWAAAAAVFGVLVLLSWGAWLLFLLWLGRALNDRLLTAGAGWYMVWYGVALPVTIVLSVGAYSELKAGNTTTSLCCRLFVAQISLALGVAYHVLLGVAAAAVAHRAPVAASE